MTDARRAAGGGRGRGAERRDTQHGKPCGGVPSCKLGFERLAVVAPHPQPVFASKRVDGRHDDAVSVHEAARRLTSSLDLNDGWGHFLYCVCHLSRKVSQHASIFVEASVARIAQTGGLGIS